MNLTSCLLAETYYSLFPTIINIFLNLKKVFRIPFFLFYAVAFAAFAFTGAASAGGKRS